MLWMVIAACVIWAVLMLPLAVAIGRAFAAADTERVDEALELLPQVDIPRQRAGADSHESQQLALD